MDQLADCPLPEAGRPFVLAIVDVEILAPQVLSRLAAVEIPGEVDARAVASPLAYHQRSTRGADGLVDQSGGAGPMSVVERGLVQRRKDTVVGIEWIHDTFSPLLPGAVRHRIITQTSEGCHGYHLSALILPFGGVMAWVWKASVHRYPARRPSALPQAARRRPGSCRRRQRPTLRWRHCIERVSGNRHGSLLRPPRRRMRKGAIPLRTGATAKHAAGWKPRPGGSGRNREWNHGARANTTSERPPPRWSPRASTTSSFHASAKPEPAPRMAGMSDAVGL